MTEKAKAVISMTRRADTAAAISAVRECAPEDLADLYCYAFEFVPAADVDTPAVAR